LGDRPFFSKKKRYRMRSFSEFEAAKNYLGMEKKINFLRID
jgi:hypothetical protein